MAFSMTSSLSPSSITVIKDGVSGKSSKRATTSGKEMTKRVGNKSSKSKLGGDKNDVQSALLGGASSSSYKEDLLRESAKMLVYSELTLGTREIDCRKQVDNKLDDLSATYTTTRELFETLYSQVANVICDTIHNI